MDGCVGGFGLSQDYNVNIKILVPIVSLLLLLLLQLSQVRWSIDFGKS